MTSEKNVNILYIDVIKKRQVTNTTYSKWYLLPGASVREVVKICDNTYTTRVLLANYRPIAAKLKATVKNASESEQYRKYLQRLEVALSRLKSALSTQVLNDKQNTKTNMTSVKKRDKEEYIPKSL